MRAAAAAALVSLVSSFKGPAARIARGTFVTTIAANTPAMHAPPPENLCEQGLQRSICAVNFAPMNFAPMDDASKQDHEPAVRAAAAAALESLVPV